MPDRRRVAAIGRVEAEVIRAFQGARPLSSAELAAHGKHFVAGWIIPGLVEGDKHAPRLLIPETFPFGRPRTAVEPAQSILTWPHLEEQGVLCVADEHAPHSPENPVTASIQAIESARDLVTKSLAGEGFEQFEDEFGSYWTRWAKANKTARSICRPAGPSRMVSAWFGDAFLAIAEDDDALRAWLEGYFGTAMTAGNFTPCRIPFIWLNKVPRPAEYPKTVAQLFALVDRDLVSKRLLEELLLDDDVRNKTVLLGCRARTGLGLGVVHVQKPPAPKGGGDPLTKGGFRQRPPPAILLARYAAFPVLGATVVRADAGWAHGRDHNPDVEVLAAKSVLILGNGSVGSPVATLLAKSGVGNIRLVDPQVLESENPSRHELGATSVKRHKAADLAASLRQRFPHLKIEAESKSWQEVARTRLEWLTSADLIISTIGNWPAEAELNAFALSQPNFPPVLYGWTEPHAAAGHAVALIGRSFCFRCLTTDLGDLRVPVTSWNGADTTKPVPACGGSFQPYGAVELEHINALIAELAVDVLTARIRVSAHRTWIGRRKVLERAGGMWNDAWIGMHGSPGDGGRILDVEISLDPECPECKIHS